MGDEKAHVDVSGMREILTTAWDKTPQFRSTLLPATIVMVSPI